MKKALADGIKVHAVATSGLDAFGEYVIRMVKGLSGAVREIGSVMGW